jgi:Zn finger protein HypA/HybF involved in hydrogenase expression
MTKNRPSIKNIYNEYRREDGFGIVRAAFRTPLGFAIGWLVSRNSLSENPELVDELIDDNKTSKNTHQISQLELRVAKLESIVNEELDYDFGSVKEDSQTVDCEYCNTVFEINTKNGTICPNCGANAIEEGETDD